MFIVVSSRDDIVDTVAIAGGGSIPVRQIREADRLWPGRDGCAGNWLGVIIDFREDIVQRCRLVDRIVRSRRVPGIIALIEPAHHDLLFELGRRGVHGWVLTPLEYGPLKKTMQRVVAETVVTPENKTFITVEGLSHAAIAEVMLPLAGPSPAARRLRYIVLRAAQGEFPIVVTGETGVGKQVVAHIIHSLSTRRSQRFVDINICGIAESVFESEFFGSIPGAFTGAVRKKGFFSMAHNGTIFLDEIGDLPQALQPKILKVVENGLLYPLGSEKPEHVDVRSICATNRNIETMVRAGGFRHDLWERIASVVIEVPPLRERLPDIPALVASILRSTRYHEVFVKPEAVRALQHHRWRGNVRELKSVLERSIAISGRRVLRARDLCFAPRIEVTFDREPGVELLD